MSKELTLTDQRLWQAAALLVGADPEDHADDEEIQPWFDYLITVRDTGKMDELINKLRASEIKR